MLYKGCPQPISAHQPASSYEILTGGVVDPSPILSVGIWNGRPGLPARPRQKATESRLIVSPRRVEYQRAAYMGLSGQYVVLVGSYGQRQAGRALIGSRVFVSAVVEVSEIPRSHPSRMEQMAPHGLCECLVFFAGRRGTICLVGIDDDNLRLPATAQG